MIQAIDQGIGGWAFNTKFLYFQKKKKIFAAFFVKGSFFCCGSSMFLHATCISKKAPSHLRSQN